jgi:uncharacterized protein (DUF433 family)
MVYLILELLEAGVMPEQLIKDYVSSTDQRGY